MAKTKWFWNADITGWRVYGVWIAGKWFIGVSVTQEGINHPSAESTEKQANRG